MYSHSSSSRCRRIFLHIVSIIVSYCLSCCRCCRDDDDDDNNTDSCEEEEGEAVEDGNGMKREREKEMGEKAERRLGKRLRGDWERGEGDGDGEEREKRGREAQETRERKGRTRKKRHGTGAARRGTARQRREAAKDTTKNEGRLLWLPSEVPMDGPMEKLPTTTTTIIVIPLYN